MFNCVSPSCKTAILDEDVDLRCLCPKCRKPMTAARLSLQDNQQGRFMFVCAHCGITLQDENTDMNVTSTTTTNNNNNNAKLHTLSEMDEVTLLLNIISLFKALFHSQTMEEMKSRNDQIKLLCSVWPQENQSAAMLRLLEQVHKLVLYLFLSTRLCQLDNESESFRIDSNQASLAQIQSQSRNNLNTIMEQLKQYAQDLKVAKENLEDATTSTQAFATAMEQAAMTKEDFETQLASSASSSSSSSSSNVGNTLTQLRLQAQEANKMYQTAQARYTIAKSLLMDEETKFHSAESMIQSSVTALKAQLMEIQSDLTTKKASISADIQFSNQKRKEAKVHEDQLRMLTQRIHSCCEKWVDTAFGSSSTIYTMPQFTHFISTLVELVMFLTKNHFPSSMDVWLKEFPTCSAEWTDMKALGMQFNQDSPCVTCSLPQVCHTGSGGSSCSGLECVLCPYDTSHKTLENVSASSSSSSSSSTTTTINPVVFAERLLAKEITRLLSLGWTLANVDSICTDCGSRRMKNEVGETVSCVLCNADAQFLQRIVTREIGLCVQKGWYLHETNCDECGVMLVSSLVDGPKQCIVCDKEVA